jgi:hypothetical protein
MAIYRPAKPRWPALVLTAAAGLVVGVAGGWLIAARSEPDTTEAARSIRSSLDRAAGSLEIVGIEYREAVRGREVVARAEYEGARDAALRARSLFAEIRQPLAVLDAEAAAEITADLNGLVEAVESTAEENDVAQMASSTEDRLRAFGRP